MVTNNYPNELKDKNNYATIFNRHDNFCRVN